MKKVLICGANGMVGSAISNKLLEENQYKVIKCTRKDANLLDRSQVFSFFEKVKPDIVINSAAKVGGINANNIYPAEFMMENLAINLYLTDACYEHNVARFINLGSSCIYPKEADQPLKEECLLTGPLEKTNEAYALAKICGLELCRHYRNQYGVNFHSLMPTNLYGNNDNYHLENSHVLPAFIRKFHEAKEANRPSVELWGSGRPRREFLHANDLADAISFLLNLDDLPDVINVGTGTDITISDLSHIVAEVVGYEGAIVYDPNMPDGTSVKRLDMSVMDNLGWKPKIDLYDGIEKTYQDFLERLKNNTLRD